MTKSKRKNLVFLAIVVLVVLNILHWWPDASGKVSNTPQSDSEINLDEISVRGVSTEKLPAMSRDIFYPKRIVEPVRQPVVHALPVPTLPVKSQEELAIESATAELSQIQCAGISRMGNRMNAYLINAGEALLVKSGDKVGSRFIVEKIVSDGVTLHDPVTGVGGSISISNKK